MEILLIAIVVTLGLLFNIWLIKKAFGFGNGSSGDSVKHKAKASVDIEKQIADLGNIGIHLNKGVTFEDLYLSFSKETYEDDPYVLLLSMMGSEIEAEPWGRHFSDDVWYLDYECIEGDGSYTRIVENLARIAGMMDRIHDLSDKVDLKVAHANLSFTLDGKRHEFSPLIDNDWADAETVSTLTKLFEATVDDGRKFWASDEGQANSFVFLNDADANQLNLVVPLLVKRFT